MQRSLLRLVDQQQIECVLTVFEAYVLDLDCVRLFPGRRISEGGDQTLDRVIHTDRDCLISCSFFVDQDDSRHIDQFSGLLAHHLDHLHKDVTEPDLLIDHIRNTLRIRAGIEQLDTILIIGSLQRAVSGIGKASPNVTVPY